MNDTDVVYFPLVKPPCLRTGGFSAPVDPGIWELDSGWLERDRELHQRQREQCWDKLVRIEALGYADILICPDCSSTFEDD